MTDKKDIQGMTWEESTEHLLIVCEELRAELNVARVEYGDLHDSYMHYKTELDAANERNKNQDEIYNQTMEDYAEVWAERDHLLADIERKDELLRDCNTLLLEHIRLGDPLCKYSAVRNRIAAELETE